MTTALRSGTFLLDMSWKSIDSVVFLRKRVRLQILAFVQFTEVDNTHAGGEIAAQLFLRNSLRVAPERVKTESLLVIN